MHFYFLMRKTYLTFCEKTSQSQPIALSNFKIITACIKKRQMKAGTFQFGITVSMYIPINKKNMLRQTRKIRALPLLIPTLTNT